MLKTYYELHEDYRMLKDNANVDDYCKEYDKVGAWIDTKVLKTFNDPKDALQELEKYTCNNPNWYFIREIIVEIRNDEEIDTNQGEFFYAFAKEELQ